MGNALSQVIRDAFISNQRLKLESPLLPRFQGPLTPQSGISSPNDSDAISTSTDQQTSAEDDIIHTFMCCVFKGKSKFDKKIRDQLRKISRSRTPPKSRDTYKVHTNVTLLWGTTTSQDHFETIALFVTKARGLKGIQGLRELGFDYRNDAEKNSDSDKSGTVINLYELDQESDLEAGIYDTTIKANNNEIRASESTPSLTSASEDSENQSRASHCLHHNAHLYHIRSNTFITEKNRKQFVADGEMYEQIARLCQEVAHDIMISEGDLEWVTICNDEKLGTDPIRALVSKREFDGEKKINKSGDNLINQTLLIITGKGKVRAGIFSRQHLITTGLEESTAIQFVREANKRNMNVIMLDPNARGDRHGMTTFEKSMNALFSSDLDSSPNHNITPDSIYVLAHSQGGAQLVRYLMEKEKSFLIPKFTSIAFTDSTHNIQWVKENQSMSTLLGSANCLYLKSSNPYYDDDWDKRVAGEIVETDHYWEHRFGKIRTLWAGTKEHSLTNWEARNCIWDHFNKTQGFPSNIQKNENQN